MARLYDSIPVLEDLAVVRPVRLAAVSFVPPAHDHHRRGVDLTSLRAEILKVAKDRPDFICFPEACACIKEGWERGINYAPELGPFVAAVGELAQEAGVALVVPFLERYKGQVYNSVPVVDRNGNMVLVYRKNYPGVVELSAGVAPGWEVPVAECDGVRVGAAVCFDVNFPQVAAELERHRARVVFWPSMFWGGRLLQHWALRYGFYIVVAYTTESAIIDMSGRYLAKQGEGMDLVKSRLLPPWAVAEVNADREVFHLDCNEQKIPAIREKYGPDVEIQVHEPERFLLLASRKEELSVEQVANEFHLETLRDYLARSAQQRIERLPSPACHGRSPTT
jgi:predicted amidohydrolase